MVRAVSFVDFTRCVLKIEICDYAVFSYLFSDPTRSNATDGSFQNFEAPTYVDFRAEASQHHKQKDEFFKKAAQAFSNKQGQLAQFYAQQVGPHAGMNLGPSCPKVGAEYYQKYQKHYQNLLSYPILSTLW